MSSDHKITGASQVNANPSSTYPKVSLKVAIVAALVAIAAIALVYAEVKYRFVSTVFSFVVANPLILGVIALVVVIGYLLYRNGRHTAPVDELQSDVISNEVDRALDANVDAWIDERIRDWGLNIQTTVRDEVQRIVPVSEQELLETAGSDSMLVTRFRDDFLYRENYRATIHGARRILDLILQSDEELVVIAGHTGRRELQCYRDRHARRLREGPLSLRWLMNPMFNVQI